LTGAFRCIFFKASFIDHDVSPLNQKQHSTAVGIDAASMRGLKADRMAASDVKSIRVDSGQLQHGVEAQALFLHLVRARHCQTKAIVSEVSMPQSANSLLQRFDRRRCATGLTPVLRAPLIDEHELVSISSFLRDRLV
jgi:hypothetical protein